MIVEKQGENYNDAAIPWLVRKTLNIRRSKYRQYSACNAIV